MRHILASVQLKRGLEERWHRLYRIAYSWSHDTHLSKDLVQDTVAKALKNSHQLRDEQSLDAWLFKILLNGWRDVCRKQKDIVALDQHQLVDDISPEMLHEREIMIQKVRKAVQKLKQEHREVVTLVDLEQMSYKEVADILSIPTGTVMSRLCRARKQLREALQDMLPKDAQGSNIEGIK